MIVGFVHEVVIKYFDAPTALKRNFFPLLRSYHLLLVYIEYKK